jgi:hypothetical protein
VEKCKNDDENKAMLWFKRGERSPKLIEAITKETELLIEDHLQMLKKKSSKINFLIKYFNFLLAYFFLK